MGQIFYAVLLVLILRVWLDPSLVAEWAVEYQMAKPKAVVNWVEHNRGPEELENIREHLEREQEATFR